MPRNDGFTNRARDYQATRVKSNSPLFKNSIKEADSLQREFRKYENDIEGYAKDFFDITLWEKQREICNALLEHKLVCVRSAHSTGKSYLLGILINFFYDTLNPLIGIGTAPTQALVKQVMFGYARKFRSKAKTLSDDWRGSVEPNLKSDEDHYFLGLVTASGDAAQGRHGPNVVLIVDEAVGVTDPGMWEALESLMIGDNVYVLCIYNPTNPSSYVSNLELQPDWYTVVMSAYDHPNIWKGIDNLIDGKPETYKLPYPGAINLKRFEQLLKQWSHRISEKEYDPRRDVILPSSMIDGNYEFYRPGPRAEARLFGRWPIISFDNVFSEYEIDGCSSLILPDNPKDVLSIGVDVARFGSDFSAFCVRKGGRILLLEEVNGLDTVAVKNKTIELAKQYSHIHETPEREIDIAVDVIGMGAGVVDQLLEVEYKVTPVNVAERAWNPEEYINTRTELWFETQKLFYNNQISLARLPGMTTNNLKKQLLGPRYDYDGKDKKRLESKAQTKKRIERSPDLADALMLSFAVNSDFSNGLSMDED